MTSAWPAVSAPGGRPRRCPAAPVAGSSAGTPEKLAYRNLPSDRKSTRLNSSHVEISYAVFCLKKKTDKPLVESPSAFARPRAWRLLTVWAAVSSFCFCSRVEPVGPRYLSALADDGLLPAPFGR